jgi:hypothetical protein
VSEPVHTCVERSRRRECGPRDSRRPRSTSTAGYLARLQEDPPDHCALTNHVVVVVAHWPDGRETFARLRISGDIVPPQMGVVSAFHRDLAAVLDFLRGFDSMEQRIRPRRLPAHYGAAADDTIYISMCSGGAMVKMSVAEQAQFILGQLSILGVAIVVTLVELAIWLAN